MSQSLPIARLRLLRVEVSGPSGVPTPRGVPRQDEGIRVHPQDALTLDGPGGRIGDVIPPAKGHAMNRFLLAVTLSCIGGGLGAGTALAADVPALYQKHCAACHGGNGRGGTATPPIAGMSASAVEKAVNAHRPPMDKTGMTADEVAGMGRYVASLKK
jgi:mono/diheme cytochrome c family protein